MISEPLPKDFNELIERLERIKRMGYVKTHRAGPTGVGKTLEDLLGIRENNVPGPNAVTLELKSARKNSRSMVTLITKSPLPRGANTSLLQKFGYPDPYSNRKVLHVTLAPPPSWTRIKGKKALKINIDDDKIELASVDGERLAFWEKETLGKAFKKKIPSLLYVKADCKGNRANEEFWYNEVWLLKDFDYEAIKRLLTEGTILIDIRIGQHRDGRPHDHGTGFRIYEDKLDKCFKQRTKLI
jgi:hypothetical protein